MIRKILVADDDNDLRALLCDALTDYGFKVTVVANGADAVVAAVDEHFDLYLLDMMMPGLDGIQTTRVLRKVTPTVPILGLTGHLGRGFMAQASAYGVTCVAKPIRMDALITEINEQLDGLGHK
jgi:two-component system phosphate regulon response regulator OmpR